MASISTEYSAKKTGYSIFPSTVFRVRIKITKFQKVYRTKLGTFTSTLKQKTAHHLTGGFGSGLSKSLHFKNTAGIGAADQAHLVALGDHYQVTGAQVAFFFQAADSFSDRSQTICMGAAEYRGDTTVQ